MRGCVIFNPTARGDKAVRLRRLLDRLAGECALRPTTGPGAARVLAAAALDEGFDTIIAAGGDGTVNEVVNGLAQPPDRLDGVRLGILPLGTVNVFAKELGLPADLTQAWQCIQRGRESRIDVPRVAFRHQNQQRSACFIQMAGAGLDSRAIERLDWTWKKRFGPLAYVLAGVQALRGPQPVITAVGGGRQAAGQLVLLGNGRFYGGRIPVFPGGDLRDGQLEVRVFPRVGWGSLVRFGCGWLRGRPWPQPGEALFRAESVTLSCAEPVPFQLDGDNVGLLPATFAVQPRALRVIGP